MTPGKAVAAALVAAAGTALALVAAGRGHGLALLALVLAVGAAALGFLARRLRRELPSHAPFGPSPAAGQRRAEPVAQLEAIRRALEAASWSEAELSHRLGPLVREVAATRLARHHGVDLARQPSRAQELIGGGRVWDLAGPWQGGRDTQAGGWTRRALEDLLDELEAI